MDERIKLAIDLSVSMVVGELAEELPEDENIILGKFIKSNTGRQLLNEETKLWWCGPSDIAEMYKKEICSA